jgi:UDP-2-acetamido-2,6-beta-L-arabino-hexul-4-ose reductase
MTEQIGITGATGFIGSHLASALTVAGYEPNRFEGDICNAKDVDEFVASFSTTFHLAGKNRGPDGEILRTNLEGTKNIAAAAARHGTRHVIFSSTKQILRNPGSSYAISKIGAEEALCAIAGINRCSVTIVRLPNVYGPGCKPFYNSVIATFCWYEASGLGDRMPIIGDGSQKADYVPIDSVIETLVHSISFADPLNRIDVTGETFSVRQLADIIHDPEKRKQHPALEASQLFFSNPQGLPQKRVKGYPVHKNASGSFQELLHEAEVTFGQLSICTIEVGHERGGHYHTRKEEWFCVVQGRMAIDFYTPHGEYLQTQLLTADSQRFVHIPAMYLHSVRNVGSDQVKFLIVCNEKFDPADADTHTRTQS